MKKVWAISAILIFLCTVSPALAQEMDIDDEEMIALVADMDTGETATMQQMAQGPGPQERRRDREGQMRTGPGWQRMGGWHGGLVSYLGLSPDQLNRMRDLWRRYYVDTRNARFDLMAKRIEMQRVFTDPKANAATVTAAQNQLSALRERLAARRAQAMIEWRGILTPEQIEKLDVMMFAHRGMGRAGGGMGMGMGTMMPGTDGLGMMHGQME